MRRLVLCAAQGLVGTENGSWDGGELTVSRDEVEMRLLGYKRRLGCPELVEQPAARGFEHFSRIADGNGLCWCC